MTFTPMFAGIDPGVTGAIGFVQADGRFAAVVDMPCLVQTTGRRLIDAAALAEVLRERGPVFVLVERVGPRPGESPTSAFSFGHTFGSILAVPATIGVPHDVIQPATWKRRAGIPPGADKACSIATAKRLLPSAAGHLARVKDDGRAEALLLAVQAWERRHVATPDHSG